MAAIVLPRAQHLPAERVAGELRLGEHAEDAVVRRVLLHQQLLEDDLALGLQVLGAEGGTRDDVAQQVEAEVEVTGRERVSKAVYSSVVYAFISPPTASTASAISLALRSSVP
jgi:hypothetical protein